MIIFWNPLKKRRQMLRRLERIMELQRGRGVANCRERKFAYPPHAGDINSGTHSADPFCQCWVRCSGIDCPRLSSLLIISYHQAPFNSQTFITSNVFDCLSPGFSQLSGSLSPPPTSQLHNCRNCPTLSTLQFRFVQHPSCSALQFS